MSEFTTAARPYAKAIFELAQEQGTQKQWSDSLATLGAIVSDSAMADLLDRPSLRKDQLADLIIQIGGEAFDVNSTNLVRLLAENGRLKAIPALRDIYETLCSEAEGVIDATVVSAFELDSNQIAKLAGSLTKRLGKEVKLECTVDESLLGGVVIHAGDLVIDGSLKGRLSKMTSLLSR